MKVEDILVMTEHELRGYVVSCLKKKKTPHTVTKDYIITQNEGTLPLICVHTDIVGNVPPTKSQIVKKGKVLSVKGARVLGADDRAGVFIALNLLSRDDFNFAFFAQEEAGCKGSSQFTFTEDLYQYSCFIGLDRASRGGMQNIAKYDYDNQELMDLFDYPESSGSVCDASVLSENSDIACVNLSVGYDNEHTNRETLDLDLMYETLQIMEDIVIPETIYKYQVNRNSWRKWLSWEKDVETKYSPVVCDNCGLHSVLYIVDGMYVCEDCIVEVEDAYMIGSVAQI